MHNLLLVLLHYQFQLQFKGSDNQDTKQDVTSDPNENVVTYHVTKPGQDAYIVDDFNKVEKN